MKQLIENENPKIVSFFHQRSKSSTSRIIVPYMYHKSFLRTHREDKKNKLLHKDDLQVFDDIADLMQRSANKAVSPEKEYQVGTAWELMNKTIAGSELDWTFDQAGIFSVVVQIGTAEHTYWPSKNLVTSLLDMVCYVEECDTFKF
jgi:hypothetical protein